MPMWSVAPLLDVSAVRMVKRDDAIRECDSDVGCWLDACVAAARSAVGGGGAQRARAQEPLERGVERDGRPHQRDAHGQSGVRAADLLVLLLV
eukprot:2338293-Rhodomonas_salina.2